MGFTANLRKVFDFIYRKELDKGLFEHEFDHVFVGEFQGQLSINRSEVEAFEYVNFDKLTARIHKGPHHYTEWFKISLPEVHTRLSL